MPKLTGGLCGSYHPRQRQHLDIVDPMLKLNWTDTNITSTGLMPDRFAPYGHNSDLAAYYEEKRREYDAHMAALDRDLCQMQRGLRILPLSRV
jgi:hypothetical protein